jgi:hypothetical protein
MTIPQQVSVAQLVRSLHRNRSATDSIPAKRAKSFIFRNCSWLGPILLHFGVARIEKHLNEHNLESHVQ